MAPTATGIGDTGAVDDSGPASGAVDGAGPASGAVDGAGAATPMPSVLCPHCGASIDGRRARPSGMLWRLGCPDCGLQLVRRPDGDWAGIRG